ncbi:MAG: beta-lactamase family protein [Ignavibacterium sp.]|jgi:CubicO group peptidase (beta-lactamase class C family)
MQRLLLIMVLACSMGWSQYHPPVFPDSDRAQRVMATQGFVEAMFREFMKQRNAPGLVYGVMLDGKLLYSGGFGVTNLERGYKADPTSLFRIASMSKSITALAILQLRDAGKLSLEDPASRYIPEMKGLRLLTSDSPEITIRHLLTHGSGLPEDNAWGDRQLDATDAELRKLMADGPSFSTPVGTEYEYSNVGFALLGQIVQVVSGMSFEEYTTKRIFEPLGMKNTVWEFSKAPAEKLALGYGWIEGKHEIIPLLHHGSYGAMGGLITSIEDFAKYVAMHLGTWPARDGAETYPLKRSSLREMHHPWRFDRVNARFRYPNGRECAMASAYAYGLRWTEDCDGVVSVGHSGGLPGFGSNWTMLPDYGLAVMSFANRTYAGTASVNAAILDSILAVTGLEPRKLPIPDILKKRAQELVDFLPDWESAEGSGLFGENFFLDESLEARRRNTRALFDEVGPISARREIVPENQLRGTFILEGTSADISVYFTLTPEPDPLFQVVRIRKVEKR